MAAPAAAAAAMEAGSAGETAAVQQQGSSSAPVPLHLMQQLLLSTLDPRQSVREQAEQQLLGARQSELQLFLLSLACVIDEPLPAAPPLVPAAVAALQEQLLAKQIAAVTFKNCISAKDPVLDNDAAEQWRALPEEAKQTMRLQLLAAIKTEHNQVASAVCQVLSKIGRIELPANGFPELLPSLLALVTEATLQQPPVINAVNDAEAAAAAASVQRSKAYGRNALTCLAYICEEHADIVEETGEDPAVILSEAHCNSILTAVVQGMKDDDFQLKIAALKALYHALIFSRKNFENETERTYILQVLLENLRVPCEAVKVSAFECIVNVAQEYYELLAPYMPAVAPLSWEAMRCPEERVAIAAMELWNTLADIEIELQSSKEPSTAAETDGVGGTTSSGGVHGSSLNKNSTGAPSHSSAVLTGAAACFSGSPNNSSGSTTSPLTASGGSNSSSSNSSNRALAADGGPLSRGVDDAGNGSSVEGGGSLGRKNCHIIQQALPFLLPILLNALTNQSSEELDAADTWTPAMAAGTCLSLCAQVVGDEVLSPVVQFVSAHFGSQEWKQREAAVFAFGSILQGPSTAALTPLIEESFTSLVAVLQDPSVAVRDTAAWTLGRIASFHSSVILNKLLLPPTSPTSAAATASAPTDATVAAQNPQQQSVPPQQVQQQEGPLLAAIVARLADKPRVATHVCWLLEQLASQVSAVPVSAASSPSLPTTPGAPSSAASSSVVSPIDPLFEKLCSAVIAVAERPDADEKGLREAAFSALAALIGSAGDRCKPALMQMLDHFVNQLTQSFTVEQTDSIRQRQGLLCGAIQVLCTRLGDEVKSVAVQIWTPLSRLFRGPAAAAGNSSSLSCSSSDISTNDALLATSALVRAAGPAAEAFSEEVVAVIASGLSSSTGSAAGSSGGAAGAAGATAGSTTTDELQTVRICVELIGDISGAIGPSFARYSGPLLGKMYQMLQDPTVERTLKPSMMTAVGDAAMQMGGDNFAPFLDSFMGILHQAGNTSYDVGPANWQENLDWLWYIHDLRESVMSAYMSIVYSMKEKHMQTVLKPYVNLMLDVVKAVAATSPKMRGMGESVNQALDLLFDLVTTYGADLAIHLEQAPFVEQLARLSDSLAAAGDPLGSTCVDRARWVREVLSRISHAGAPAVAAPAALTQA